ncbi:MAG: radical SAM protein [Proteobacteria bacterium]|nr:radical SAM protein [Pseudomonadota bacterium]MBU0967293.1 radical SAM protein [Pseudomonadota bacterium]
MAATPFIIPFFIAHQGCPHQCVFCNQHVITGSSQWLTAELVQEEIARCLGWPRDSRRQVQVAFYGGSFTGLERGRQEELLGAVGPFLQRGEVDLIRLSTRPDYIDQAKVRFLKERGVGMVELGIQSFDAEVLARCRRGHTAEQVVEAFAHLRQAGIGVGGQLMVGLPGETTAGVLAGARRLVSLRPDLVRIYPTLVLKASPLADLLAAGRYQPLPMNRAVALCARLKEIFAAAGIPVIRMGLQPSPSLEHDLVAGPYHPAFGELVLSRLYFKRMRKSLAILQKERGCAKIRLMLSAADRSLFQGQKRCSAGRLTALGLLDEVELVFLPGQPRLTINHEIIHVSFDPHC